MSDLLETVAGTVAHSRQSSSAQAWFGGGDRVGYAPQARALLSEKTRPSGFSLGGIGSRSAGRDNIAG